MIKFKEDIYKRKADKVSIVYLLDTEKMRVIVRIISSNLCEPISDFKYSKYTVEEVKKHLIYLGFDLVYSCQCVKETLC